MKRRSFCPHSLVERMKRGGREMVEELLGNSLYLGAARESVSASFRVPNEAEAPLFVQADFGLIQDDEGALHSRLVEIQGFPSLYAYQPVLAETYRDAYDLDPTLPYLPNGLSRDGYFARLREAILGDEDPAQTVLLEIDPANQKTRVDFALTERECGIRTVDVRGLRLRGRKLYYDRDGAETEIRRIYNRVIVDELERRGEEIPFEWNDDLDVAWAGHPNWFFLLSKFSFTVAEARMRAGDLVSRSGAAGGRSGRLGAQAAFLVRGNRSGGGACAGGSGCHPEDAPPRLHPPTADAIYPDPWSPALGSRRSRAG
ncbi:MAG: hypothetical protein U5J83_14355 [Bryobacterales bacterium]|nr:hypothetical protein [Bryobacterales bacterium]